MQEDKRSLDKASGVTKRINKIFSDPQNQVDIENQRGIQGLIPTPDITMILFYFDNSI